MNRQQEELLRRAIEPFGATFEATDGKRHEKVFIHRGDQSRLVVKSTTASCPHAAKNFLADVRRALRELDHG